MTISRDDTERTDPANGDLAPSAVEELEYWTKQLDAAGELSDVLRRRLDPERRREEFPTLLADTLLPMMQLHFGLDGPVRCVELGSGPLTSLAWGVDAGLLDLTAVDVLGDEYGALLERNGHGHFPVRPLAGTGETLDELLEPGTFHLAFCRNALDHTDDLPRCLDNLVELLVPDGVLYLQHHVEEGSNREWSDSHNWDLSFHVGLRATDRTGRTTQLTPRDDLELVHLNYRAPVLDGWVDAVYRKVSGAG